MSIIDLFRACKEFEMSKIPVIEVEFSDGRVFRVRASIIAEDRARYLANNDNPGGSSSTNWLQTFEAEFDYAIDDNAELLDWANNNMDWAQLETAAVEVQAKKVIDQNAEWSNAKKQVIR